MQLGRSSHMVNCMDSDCMCACELLSDGWLKVVHGHQTLIR